MKNLKIFTDKIEDTAKEQINILLEQDAFKDSKVRIMPDVHAGAGCVIGFTANLGDKVVPNIVGVDIGCGMLTIKLGKVEIDLESLDNFITENIPNGFNINEKIQFDYIKEIESLKCFSNLKGDSIKFNRAIGSLGGGNHFIEINEDKKGMKYLVIHSGSRNLGNQVAKYYQKLAIEYHNNLDTDYDKKKNEIIKNLKEKNMQDRIQDTLLELDKNYIKENTIPDNLCYLEGDLAQDYLHDMKICQDYANKNRELIASKILKFIFDENHNDIGNIHIGNDFIEIDGEKFSQCFDYFHTIHNYIDFEDNIVRKGAIKANKDELVLIPINMRDGSILAKGKGNEDWNNSAPHGAGRVMSRTQAHKELSLDEFKKSMNGVYSTSVCDSTLDESPMAYKSIDDIVNNIGDTVEIIDILKPIYNFKSK